MTTRTRITLLLAVVLLGAMLLGCDGIDGTGDARREWNRDVAGRQRGLVRPTATVEVIE